MIYTNTSILTAIVCALSILSVFVDGQINLRHGNGRVFAEILAASKGRSLEEEMIEDIQFADFSVPFSMSLTGSKQTKSTKKGKEGGNKSSKNGGAQMHAPVVTLGMGGFHGDSHDKGATLAATSVSSETSKGLLMKRKHTEAKYAVAKLVKNSKKAGNSRRTK